MNGSNIGPPPSRFIRRGKKSKSVGNITTVQSVDIISEECAVPDNEYDTILMFIIDDV